MFSDYILVIQLPLRLSQAISEYLGDKPDRKATWTELIKYFESIFKTPVISFRIFLMTRGALDSSNKESESQRNNNLHFIWVPTVIRVVEIGIEKRLKTVLYEHGIIDLSKFGKDILFDSVDTPTDKKLKITLELSSDIKLTAVLEVVNITDPDIDEEATEEDEWPTDTDGFTTLDG